MKRKLFYFLIFSSFAFNMQVVSAQSDSGNAVKEFFRGLLFCGPGNRMCDKDYNPNLPNAMFESPEQLVQFFTQFDSYMAGRRELVSKPSKSTPSETPPVNTQAQSQQNSPQKSSIVVTAAPPSKLNNPIDADSLQKTIKANPTLGGAIQAYMQKKPESIPTLKIYAEGGEPFAQFFLALAYNDEWTGYQNQAEACKWFRESGTTGLSQARYFMAQRAYVKSSCFSQTPTLEQAKIWADLAAQTNDPSLKKDAQELTQEILRAQIAGGK